MARFVERAGKVYIEADSGLALAYFDNDGTFVPLFGASAVDANGNKVAGTKAVVSSFPPNTHAGSGSPR